MTKRRKAIGHEDSYDKEPQCSWWYKLRVPFRHTWLSIVLGLVERCHNTGNPWFFHPVALTLIECFSHLCGPRQLSPHSNQSRGREGRKAASPLH